MFEFFDPGGLIDGELELVLIEEFPGDKSIGYVPAYRFSIWHSGIGMEMGNIELRIGNTENILMYAGHIGYEVLPEYHGHHYAGRSMRLLLPLAKKHGFKEIWITCNPENQPSRRTCQFAGAEFVEIVDIPPENDQYLTGEREKCRYRIRFD